MLAASTYTFEEFSGSECSGTVDYSYTYDLDTCADSGGTYAQSCYYSQTVAPTSAPTGPSHSPSPAPTLSPTSQAIATGYFYYLYYASSSTCAATASFSQAYVIAFGICSGSGDSYQKTTSTGRPNTEGYLEVTVSYYSNDACTELTDTYDESYYLGCEDGYLYNYSTAYPSLPGGSYLAAR